MTVDWMQGLTLFAPVRRYDVLIKRRKGERMIHIDWHPAIRMIEPPPCDWGLGVGRARLVCEVGLHLTDLSEPMAARRMGVIYTRTSSAKCFEPAG